jgi:hypothetical protein
MKLQNLIGQRFGRLIVVDRYVYDGKQPKWLCRCDCGNDKVVFGNHLRSGITKSCGCLSKEIAPSRGRKSKIGERSLKHGDFGTRLYGIWAAMKRRCQNPNVKYYKDYGGRGIRVCSEWQDYIPFKEWAMSNGYDDGLTLDRIDVDGNYCPDNCRWITMFEQEQNRRNTNRIEYNGQMYTIREAANITGLTYRTIKGRVERGWSGERIFETKLMKNQFS